MKREEIAEGVFTTGIVVKKEISVTRGEFKLRMTQVERIAIRQLAMSDAIVYDFMDLLSDIEIVPLDQPEVIDGINYCSSLGAFSKERANEILGNN